MNAPWQDFANMMSRDIIRNKALDLEMMTGTWKEATGFLLKRILEHGQDFYAGDPAIRSLRNSVDELRRLATAIENVQHRITEKQETAA